MQDIPKVEVRSDAELWGWMGENHAGGSVWLVTWKAAHRDKYVSRDAVLDALVAYGWIDGRRMKLDTDRTMQLIAPRAQKAWARSYKDRAERLISEGRMAAPGLAAIEAGRVAGLWDWSNPVDDLEMPADLAAALGDGANWFAAAAPSYRRNVLRYIAQAKRVETRAKRVGLVADHAKRGEKLPQY